MRNRILLAATFALLALALISCGQGGANSNANTPGKPANSNTGAGNANSAQSSDAKTEIKNENRPGGQQAKGLPADQKVPLPADWVYYSDEVKGYGFSLPEGSTGENSTVDGMDIFEAKVPPPSDVQVEIYAWKDKTLTKQELMDMTIEGRKNDGETVTLGKVLGEWDDYTAHEATSVDRNSKKYKMTILVGTDITDNYVMVVFTEESKYEANKDIITKIWSNFEMYSGGASGNS